MYGEDVSLYVNGESNYRTVLGAVMSLVTLFFVSTYGAVKINKIMNKLDTLHQ